MDSHKDNQRVRDICFVLYQRELEARQKEHEKFMKLSEDDKELHLAEKKYTEKIRKKEEKQIYNSKHYKNTLNNKETE
jgi:hypothetical protein